MTDPKEDALKVIEAQKKFPKKPILCTYMGGLYSKQGGRLLEEKGIPDFNDLRKAAKAMKVLIERGKLAKK
jgi:acyl-CoA synthetase (NDP forming)